MWRKNKTGSYLNAAGFWTCAWFVGVTLAWATAAHGDDAVPFTGDDLDFFEKRVRPILVARCYECHSAASKSLQGGLQLDQRATLLAGGDSGPAVDPESPDSSRLLVAVRYDSEQIQMPPSGKIPDGEIAALAEWLRRGVPFPADHVEVQARANVDIEAGRSHWAFRPLATGKVPEVLLDLGQNWAQTRIDPFVWRGQADQGLEPAPSASRSALIRRLTFDLLGLPPTQDEIDTFANDSAPDAYPRLVDRLLASPHYGERWGRYWLDLARYCDVPESWREGVAQAWLYRDWVTTALNADLSYDDFVRYQFAADQLPGTQPQDHAALGFLGLSPTYWKELKLDHFMIKQVVAEEWEERIEAIGGTFLGLTLACARCHDHKFDPLTMRDYYGLAGVMASIQQVDRSLLPAEQATAARQAKQQISELQKQVDKLLAGKSATEEDRAKADQLRGQIDAIRGATPSVNQPEAFGISDASLQVLPDGAARTKLVYQPDEPQDVALQIRGNAANPGTIVPRGFPAVFAAAGSTQGRTFHEGSGRRELAEAIVTDAAPLTARVFVNRVWQQHFGRGIVTTPSNFGVQGAVPSHPELLDDLAARFIEHGWSLKWLHREIVLSATYRQSAEAAESRQRDPDNIWLARMPLRRLDVEAWRDAILSATGELDLRIGGPAQDLTQLDNRRRTTYGTVKRRELADLLRLYDFPDPVSHVASRDRTTTPLQQLFVLNSPFIRERSARLLDLIPDRGDEAARVRAFISQVFVRDAQTEEVSAMLEFLSAAQRSGSDSHEAWLQLAQVLLVSNEQMFVE
jgi:hypothetical protein